MEPRTDNYVKLGNIYINNPSECFICKRNGLTPEEYYCAECGFPQNGTHDEMKAFYIDYVNKNQDFNESVKNLKATSTTLFVIAALTFLGALIQFTMSGPLEGIIVSVLAVIFVGLGLWAQSKPAPAAISGLVIYVSVVILDLVVGLSEGDASGLKGMAIKVVIIIFLIRGVMGALKAEKYRKEKGWDWTKAE
ncbi:MAG: hypothetical protein MH137_09895 [Flavobacteriales bacterium]|nr:hypothetical protein [Flavobacteriales bacterium]